MRLKIKITGGFFGNSGENWSCNKATVIKLGLACMRIVQHHQTDKLGMVRWKIPDERNYVLAFLVSTVARDFLCSTCLTGNGKSWNRCGSSRPAIAYNASKRVADPFGGFSR